jgi:YHS domain-containing protein
VAALGSALLKNVRASVPLFSLWLVVGPTDTPVDPVCQLPIDRRSAAGRLRYRRSEHWFCSLTCAAVFASNPSWYAAVSTKLAEVATAEQRKASPLSARGRVR